MQLVEVMFAAFVLARHMSWPVVSQPTVVNRQTSLKPVIVISCL
jgi:hypothetical protein